MQAPAPVPSVKAAVPDDCPPGVTAIIEHLCVSDCHAYGDLIEWCESRGDCTVAVVCPACSTQFIIDDDEMVVLRRWTEVNGTHFGCGVAFAD